MSSVTTESDTTLDPGSGDSDTSSSLIKFYEYYDENGNLVSESGYLLDADGNLVVASDSDLTGAYTATAADGTVYTVGEDASIVNNMILSSVKEGDEGTSVDAYGNIVTTEGYLIDQSDSSGTTLLSLTADAEIVAQTSAVATDSEGSSVEVVSGDGYVFETYDSEAGTVYVSVTAVSATYYDSYGSLLDSTGSYLANEDGSQLLVDSDTVTLGTYYAVSDGSAGTYYYPVSLDSPTGSYYVLASGDATQMYFNGTQITDDQYVYYNTTGGTYYLLDGTTSLTSFVYYDPETSDTNATVTSGVIRVLEDASDIEDGGYYVYIEFSSTDNNNISYTIYYGTASTSASGNARTGDAVSVTINSVTYYFEYSTTYTNTSTSALFTDLYAALTDGDNSNTLTINYYNTSSFADATSTLTSGTLFALNDYYYNSSQTASLSSGLASLSASTVYNVTDSAAYLYYDSESSSAITTTFTSVVLFMGYELYYDATGAWVVKTSADGSTYYYADTSADSGATYLYTLVDSDSSTNTDIVQQSTYTLNGHSYLGTATESSSYYYFASTANSDNTVYSSSAGFLVDEDGYILDDAGERQLLTATSLYVYTQTVEATEDTEEATYTYIFGESDLSTYLDSDTATEVADSEDTTITYTYYNVLTGYKGTYYRDAYDNYVNAAGYLIDSDTLDIIYSVSDGLKAGYSFTALDGTTYIVSADAAIDVEGGTYTVYSGVATIRYYGDDNGNETLDAYDTEYTSDELWIILRNELDEITSYVSVESGEEVDADTWEAEYATDTATDSSAATVS